MVEVSVRHAEPHDAEALHRILSGPKAIEGKLQLPLQSVEKRREWLSEMPEGIHITWWRAWRERWSVA